MWKFKGEDFDSKLEMESYISGYYAGFPSGYLACVNKIKDLGNINDLIDILMIELEDEINKL